MDSSHSRQTRNTPFPLSSSKDSYSHTLLPGKLVWQEVTTPEGWRNKSFIPSTYPQCLLSQCYADASLKMANCPPSQACSPACRLKEGPICLKTREKSSVCTKGRVSKQHPFEGSHKPSCPQDQSCPFLSPSIDKIFFLVSTVQKTGKVSARVDRTKSQNPGLGIHWWFISCTLFYFLLDNHTFAVTLQCFL